MVVVDDHTVVRRGTREMLEREPDIAVVDDVGTIEEALAAVRRHQPTMLVVDVELPDGSGVEIVRRLVAEGSPVRCLMLSAHDDYVYFSESLAAGAAGYLLKTVSTEKFIAAVRTVALGGTVIDGVLSHRLAGRRQQPEERLAASLTAREFDVIRGLVRGRSNKEIAKDLGVGLRTVESYVSTILAKLGVRSRAEAIVYVLEHHLVTPGSAR